MSIFSASKTSGTWNPKNLATLCLFGMLVGMSFSLLDVPAFAESSKTVVTPINNDVSLEKTIIPMSVPENNLLPWGVIKGKVNDPAQGYPVIIQFFKDLDEDPVHVAQVNLKGDDSFEYRFRVLSVDDGDVTHFFKGDYYIKIFKVINTPQGNLDSV